MYSADRRQMLGVMSTVPFLGFSACRAATAAKPVDVTTFRQPGDAGDTATLGRALKAGGSVRLPAGGGSGQNGEYIVDMLELPDGAEIVGDGLATVVRSSNAQVPNVFRVDGTRPVTANITLKNMTVTGYVASQGFREHHNLVNLSGVSDCLIENIVFRGFASDGIYIGGEREGVSRVSRGNARIIIRDCVFDGVNNDNRNAISVTGGTDIKIDRCRFKRCTRPNMPGPIDFEADDFPFYVFNGISVTNCLFEDCGGNVGQVSVITPSRVRQVPRYVTISNNRFSNYIGTGSDIAIIVNRRMLPISPKMNVLIEKNVGTGGRSGIRVYSGCGIIIRDNSWTRYLGQSFIGFTAPNDGCSDVSVADRYESCGTVDGVALGIYNVAAVTVENCSFIDCGGGKSESACILLGPGKSDGIKLARNDFSAQGRGVVPVRRNSKHQLQGPLIVEPSDLAIVGPAVRP